MYYEKQILPLDVNGNFLLAIHFPRHKIGGECTRESSHAYFAHGNSKHPDRLTDITDLCCVDLTANEEHSRELAEISEVQSDIQQPEQAWIYAYQAKRALEAAKLVPRTVLTTRNGYLFVGIDAEIEDLEAGLASYVQRLIEVNTGEIEIDDREQDIFVGNSKIYPKALSYDHKKVITVDPGNTRKPVLAERNLLSQKTITKFTSIYPVSDFVSVDGHWIANDGQYLYKFPHGKNKATKKHKLPKSIFGWSATTTYSSSLVAFSGDKGLVSIMDIEDGSVRNYYPHRGCKRDDFALVKLSDDGLWLASKLGGLKELIVTSLKSGESWIVAELVDEVIIEQEEGKYRSESSIPAAFNFIGDTLLVSDSSEVREILFDRPSEDQVFISEQGKEGARVALKLDVTGSLDGLLKQAKLGRIAEVVRDVHYPACFLKSKVSKKSGWSMPNERGAFGLGESRIGGWPDLPQNLQWPTWRNRPMGFLGQVNLTELSAVQEDIRLPGTGVLLFFVGCGTDTFEREPFDQEMYMLDLLPDHRGDPGNAVKVIYVQPDIGLSRTRYEGDVLPELFSPCAVNIKKGGLSLPHEYTASYDCLPCNDSELDNYNELIDQLSTDDYENQLSGYPTMLQSTPLEWVPENLSRGRDPYFIPAKSNLQSFNKDAARWGMLLQLTSDNNPDFMWGDSGHLYIYGERVEMETGNFENCYLNFEN